MHQLFLVDVILDPNSHIFTVIKFLFQMKLSYSVCVNMNNKNSLHNLQLQKIKCVYCQIKYSWKKANF